VKRLIRKEAIEISVLAGPAFVALALFWLATLRFQSVLLAPREEPLILVMLAAGLGGLLFGYLQFSAERWLGRLGYLVHRGGGERGAFAAKVAVGLAATFAVGFGPPLVYALAHFWTSPNGPIIQWQRVLDFCSVSTIGASAYGIGVLASQLRRKVLTDLFFLAVVGGGVAFLSLAVMHAPAAWNVAVFVGLQIAFAAIFLATAETLARRGVDADLALPRGVHASVALVATPVLVLALVAGLNGIQSELLSEIRSASPLILLQRSTGDVFAVVSTGYREWHRLSPDGVIGARVEYAGKDGKEDFAAVRLPWPNFPMQAILQRTAGLRPWWEGVGYDHELVAQRWRAGRSTDFESSMDFTSGVLRLASFPGEVACFLDRENGLVRVFDIVQPSWRGEDVGERKGTERELEKSDGGRFSLATRVFRGGDLEQPVMACLVDPSDESMWYVIQDGRDRRLAPAALPGDDRFVRFEPLVQKEQAELGDPTPWPWPSPLVVGEKGTYSWDGVEFRIAEVGPDYVKATDAASIARVRPTYADSDRLEPSIEIRDGAGERVLFAATFAPRTLPQQLLSILAQGVVFLRPPIANLLSAVGTTDALEARAVLLDPTIAGGRRIGLVIVDVALAALCALTAVRWLGRRGAGAVGIGLWGGLVLLLGPLALLALWLFEPRAVARRKRSIEPEPVLVLVESRA